MAEVRSKSTTCYIVITKTTSIKYTYMHEILMKCITFFQLEYVYFVNIKKKKPNHNRNRL